MKIGDINVIDSILNLEREVSILQQTLAYIVENNKSFVKAPTENIIEEFNNSAIKALQRKYPNMQIKRK